MQVRAYIRVNVLIDVCVCIICILQYMQPIQMLFFIVKCLGPESRLCTIIMMITVISHAVFVNTTEQGAHAAK